MYRFRDTACYLSKFANFNLPHLHLAPPLGVTPVEFRKKIWRQKTRVPGLSYGVVCVILRLAVLVELRLVTDTHTQTDTRTDTRPWHIPREHSSRGKKVTSSNVPLLTPHPALPQTSLWAGLRPSPRIPTRFTPLSVCLLV